MTVEEWFRRRGYTPAPFQRQLWDAYAEGKNGLLIAPTGAGKTYAMTGAFVRQAQASAQATGKLRLLWITPLRALAGDIVNVIGELCQETLPDWKVELRTGDTASHIKVRHRKKLPEILVTTPESLHVMFSYPGATKLFDGIDCVVVDEWHDLLGTKRGIMMQLALAYLRQLSSNLQVWGMSATLGNSLQARQVLLASQTRSPATISDSRPKPLQVETILPTSIERFPWAGHMGDALLPQVLAVISKSHSTLLFTNTRNQAETWYRKLLAADKNLAGRIALHHGSLSSGQRSWVEAALHEGKLQAVIATSSLDLGVDFRPVDTVIQIGGPKGVARFMQRAGRSGHAPGKTSRIYFAPTNTLELFEAAALRQAIAQHSVEAIDPPHLSLDVLNQWLTTLGAGDGFDSDQAFNIIKTTDAYTKLSAAQWQWALDFVTDGGAALQHYDNYRKLSLTADKLIRTRNPDIARRHRLAIGAITSTATIPVHVLRGSILGSIEESFAASLRSGQTFWFGGRPLVFVRLRDNTVWVRASHTKVGITPAWTGGRLPLSSQLADLLRQQISKAERCDLDTVELQILEPLIKLQKTWSQLPRQNQLLVEQFKTRDGHHITVYPFEGRAIHEVLATLMASRLGVEPNTFSFAFNDYGFELLAAKPLEFSPQTIGQLLSLDNLEEDIQRAITEGSLPRRQFRSIAVIAGLISSGRPGKPQSNRHLQVSSENIYEVLIKYDPTNQLLQQAYDEVMDQVIDFARLSATLQRLNDSELIMTEPPHPTPFAFPLMGERIRERLSTEKMVDRLQRMQTQLEHYAERI